MKASLYKRPHLLLFLLYIMSPAVLSAPLVLGQDIPYRVLEDPKAVLSPTKAAQALQAMPANQTGAFSRGYVDKVFWLGFTLSKTDFGEQERWLELGPNFLDDIQVFFRPAGSSNNWMTKRTGDLLYGRSDLDYRNPVLIIPPPMATGYEVVIRIQTSSSVLLKASFWPPDEFANTAVRQTHFWSFYFGLAAISSILALILALVLKTRLLWATTAFSTIYVLVACIQGYLNWLLPQWGIPLQHYLTGALTLTSYALLLWLCTEAVNLKIQQPWLHNILICSSLLILALIGLLPFGLYAVAVKIQTVIYLLATALFIGSVCYSWVKVRFHPPTLLATASPLTCILASLFGMFSVLGWVPFRKEIYLVWQYALIANMLFVMALAIFQVREKRLEDLEKKQLADELAAERSASFHQRQFIGMVSHEFRTPLAVINASLTNLYHLESTPQPSRTSRYQKIQRATDRMVQLTDNCLADARLSAETLYLHLQPLNVIELLNSIIPLFETSEQHQLLLSIDSKLPNTAYSLTADASLLRIALSNVIDNAIKHTPSGTISISCSQDVKQITITICDQGSGVANLTDKEVFERYRQGKQGNKGAGLGLYVARQITQAHHGELLLASSLAQGSCFTFILPKAKEG